MSVAKYGLLAAAVLLTAAGPSGSTALAQERDTTLFRALDLVGRAVQIGVSVNEVDAADAKQAKAGVVVETVSPDGPSDKAGVKAGDTITEFDGERVRSVRQFSRLVQESTPGRGVAMTLSRGGQRVNVTVTPERHSAAEDFTTRFYDLPRAARVPTPPSPPAVPRAPRAIAPLPAMPLDRSGSVWMFSSRGLGATVESLDDQLAEYFGVKEGVLVKSVADDTAAKKAGLKAGDVITSFNGSKVYDSSDLTRGISRLDSGDEFTVEVIRDKKPQSLKGKYEGARRRSRTQPF